MELFKKHRPKLLKHLVGQEEAVKVLSGYCKSGRIPQALLLSGPSGCGKNTSAYVLKEKLGCSDTDFIEINCASSRGVDTIREIQQQMTMRPLFGKVRTWFLDEVHRATPDSMSALLRPLEFPPPHVHFILATTDPEKLLPAILTRCTKVKFVSVDDKCMTELLNGVVEKDGLDVSPNVIEKVVEAAGGSPREALVILDSVIALPEAERLDAVVKADTKKQAFELAKELVWGRPKPKVEAIMEMLRGMEGEDPEKIRLLVWACATKELLKGNPKTYARAFLILESFEQPVYVGKLGSLALYCCRVIAEA